MTTHKCSMQKKKESLIRIAESATKYRYTIIGGTLEIYDTPYNGVERASDLVEKGGIKLTPHKSMDSLQEVLDYLGHEIIRDTDYCNPMTWGASSYEGGVLRIWAQVFSDKYGYGAPKEDIALYKKGELKLYRTWYEIDIHCEEYSGWDDISYDKLRSTITGMGMNDYTNS